MPKLIARLLECHGRRSASTLGLSVLAAGTEGIGLVLLIPLLSLAGVASAPATESVGAWLGERLGLELGLYGALGLFVLVLCIRQLIVFRQRVVSMRTRLDFSQRLRGDLFTALVNAQWRFFSLGAVHRQIQILTMESLRAGNAVQQGFTLATIVIVMAVHVGIAAWLSWTYTAVAIVGAALLLPALWRRLARTRELGTRLVAANDRIYSLASNLLPMLRTAKMAGTEARLTDRFLADSDAFNATMIEQTAVSNATTAIVQLAGGALLAASVVVGIELLALDPVSLLVLVLIVARLTPLLAQAQQIGQQITHELAALDAALEAIEQWRARAEAPGDAGRTGAGRAGAGGAGASGASAGRICTGRAGAGGAGADRGDAALERPRRSIGLREVFAGYGGEHGAPFLENVTFRLPVGTTTLVSGPTGAGKSTLADVITGLLAPSAGAIELDGRALSTAERLAWRTHVGYVEQAAALLTGTIRENLSWTRDELDPAWLERVLRATLADAIVADRPGGLDAPVGEHGAALSGGQRQRIAIARELMRKPALLVLDEATSALDEPTERAMLERIAVLDPTLTLLLISHRPSAAAHADQALEIEHGRVVRCAPHEHTPLHGCSGATA